MAAANGRRGRALASVRLDQISQPYGVHKQIWPIDDVRRQKHAMGYDGDCTSTEAFSAGLPALQDERVEERNSEEHFLEGMRLRGALHPLLVDRQKPTDLHFPWAARIRRLTSSTRDRKWLRAPTILTIAVANAAAYRPSPCKGTVDTMCVIVGEHVLCARVILRPNKSEWQKGEQEQQQDTPGTVGPFSPTAEKGGILACSYPMDTGTSPRYSTALRLRSNGL